MPLIGEQPQLLYVFPMEKGSTMDIHHYRNIRIIVISRPKIVTLFSCEGPIHLALMAMSYPFLLNLLARNEYFCSRNCITGLFCKYYPARLKRHYLLCPTNDLL